MKIEFGEEEGCFYFDIRAEDLKEAVLLARFGINSTKEMRYREVFAAVNTITASFTIGKRKHPSSIIRQAK